MRDLSALNNFKTLISNCNKVFKILKLIFKPKVSNL